MKKDYSKIKRVYVAGKLNADAVNYLHNVHKMMERAEEVRQEGYSPYIPAIDLLMGIKFGYDDYHNYFDMGQVWLLASDAVILTPGYETSKGTQMEIKLAIENDIPVFEQINEMNKYFETGKLTNSIIDFETVEGEITAVYRYIDKAILYGVEKD